MLNKLQKIVVALWAAIAIPVVADVEDDLVGLYDEEELISIATGTQKQARFAPSVASVITEDDIDRMGFRSLEDAIESVPGIHVSDSLLFDDDLISIRGIRTSNNPQVLLLIDGVEVTYLFTAARPPGFRLPLNNVKRIEIIRGPGSAVYGADAFSGVISIITKSGSDIKNTTFGTRVGSFNTQDAWVQSGFANDRFEASVSVEYTKSEGDHNRIIDADAIGRSGQFRSEYEIYNSQIKATSGDFRARLYNWHLSNGGNGPGGAQVLDDIGTINVNYYQADLGYRTEIFDSLLLDARASYGFTKTEIENLLFPAGAMLPIDSDGNATGGLLTTFPNGLIGNPSSDSKVTDFDASLVSSAFDQHVIRFGFGYKKEDFDTSEQKNFGPGVLDIVSNPGQTVPSQPVDVSNTPFVYVEDVYREVYHLSVQDEWSFSNDWVLTWGVRYDDFSDVGDTINPRLALVWAVDYNLTAKLLYGRAFRAPSFSELYSQNNPSLVGNPSLDPEIIDTFETAIDYRLNRDISLSANAFYYEIDDLIDLVPVAGNLQAQNAIDQNGIGVEFSAEWKISDALVFNTNLSFQDIEVDDTGQSVADVVEQQFFASLNWKPYEWWSMKTGVHWVGERERDSMDARDDSDDYFLVNFTSKISVNELGIGLIIKNLFDEDATEPSELGPLVVPDDYPIEGRSIIAEFTYEL